MTEPVAAFADDLEDLFLDTGVRLRYPAAGIDLPHGALLDFYDEILAGGDGPGIVAGQRMITIRSGSVPGLREGETVQVGDEWLRVHQGPVRADDGALAHCVCVAGFAP